MSVTDHKIVRESAGLGTDSAELYQALSELVRAYQFRDRKRVCYYDISVTQCYALEEIIRRDGLRAQDLADLLFLDKSTTSRAISGLVSLGYVKRTRDPEDGRAQCLVPTAKGRALHTRIEKDLIRQHGSVIEDMEPKQRAAAIRVLQRLATMAKSRFEKDSCG